MQPTVASVGPYSLYILTSFLYNCRISFTRAAFRLSPPTTMTPTLPPAQFAKPAACRCPGVSFTASTSGSPSTLVTSILPSSSANTLIMRPVISGA